MVIGLTGYTGSGKSHVARLLARQADRLGYMTRIVEADQLARDLRDHDPAIKQQVKALLGDEVYDANDRSIPARISAIIFHEKNRPLRDAYEQIFVEAVSQQVCRDIRESEEDVLILDFFFIFDYLKQCLDLIDQIILVDSSPETQFQRLTQSSRAIAPTVAEERITDQRRRDPPETLRRNVDLIIKNENGTTLPDDLFERILNRQRI